MGRRFQIASVSLFPKVARRELTQVIVNREELGRLTFPLNLKYYTPSPGLITWLIDIIKQKGLTVEPTPSGWVAYRFSEKNGGTMANEDRVEVDNYTLTRNQDGSRVDFSISDMALLMVAVEDKIKEYQQHEASITHKRLKRDYQSSLKRLRDLLARLRFQVKAY